MLEKFTVIDILNTRSDSVATVGDTFVKFNRVTAEELGYPPFVHFLINPKEKQFAIQPCKEDDPNAVVFSKPKEQQKYQIPINNTAITRMIRKIAGWSAADGNWNIPGIYLTDEKALVYDLKTATKPRSKGGGWAVKRAKEAEAVAKAVTEEAEN